jgi:CheY-like chemotaxis protein
LTAQGAATVLVAQPDPDSRELVARIAEGAGHRAVRLDGASPPAVVDAAVHELALVVVVDTQATGLHDLAAITDAFATRGYPAAVVALVDGPATGERSLVAGARQVLHRPFHERELVQALEMILDPDPAEATPRAGAGTVSDAPRGSTDGEGHAFTDILRMGRQL